MRRVLAAAAALVLLAGIILALRARANPKQTSDVDATFVVHSIDGFNYRVRAENAEQAAQLMHEIIEDCKRIIVQCEVPRYTDGPESAEIREKIFGLRAFNFSNIREAALENEDMTSYTVDKQTVHMCIRKHRNTGRFEERRVLLHILLHELAHVAATSIGHTEEFHAIFVTMLIAAGRIDIDVANDFSYLRTYCGKLTSDLFDA